jgi:hypothetical protein
VQVVRRIGLGMMIVGKQPRDRMAETGDVASARDPLVQAHTLVSHDCRFAAVVPSGKSFCQGVVDGSICIVPHHHSTASALMDEDFVQGSPRGFGNVNQYQRHLKSLLVRSNRGPGILPGAFSNPFQKIF